jgi:hypothetical protein
LRRSRSVGPTAGAYEGNEGSGHRGRANPSGRPG